MSSPLLLALLVTAPAPGRGGREARSQREPAGPPGLVFVRGGRTPVGTPPEEAVALAERHRHFLGNLAGEQPQTVVPVADFWIQVSEVTNEQFEVFVRSTGRRPPLHWADPVEVDWARKTFLATPRDARAHHEKWDPESWWREHWRETAWAVPEDAARKPVVHVSHDDAAAYARWAGLRLPTEAEWTRAARGSDGERRYPWGGEWRAEACANFENAPRRDGEPVLAPVGAHPEGASPGGVFDLVGSVWEWTSSPYRPFPGYKPLLIAAAVRGGPQERLEAAFGRGERVLLGGSFRTPSPALACRIATRASLGDADAAPDVGFRCARSAKAGLDAIERALESELRFALGREALATERTLGLERWRTLEEAAADLASAGDPGRESRPAVPSRGAGAPAVPGYAILAAHEGMSFAPVRELDLLGAADLLREAREKGVLLGALRTDLPLEEPPLPPGTYLVSFRAKGRSRPGSDPHEDAAHDRIVFREAGGALTSALRAEVPAETRAIPGALAGAKALERDRDRIRFDFAVPFRSATKAAAFSLSLRVRPGALAGEWVE